MRRHLCIVCSSEKEKESVSKKRSVQSMLSRSNDTEIPKRDAIPNRRRREFSRIEYIDLHVLSPQKGNEREKKRIGKTRKNETYKPHQSLIRSSSSSKEEEEEDDKNTRQQEEEDNENVTTREEDFFKTYL